MRKSPMRRRTFTKLAGVAAVAGVAGCNDEEAPPDDDLEDDTDLEPDDDEPIDDEDDEEEPVDDEPDDEDEPDEEATVQVASHEEYGDILVGPDGRSLYMFDEDEQDAGQSACHDGCAEQWPPLTITADEPVAGEGVTAELTTFERADEEDEENDLADEEEEEPDDEELDNGEEGEQEEENDEMEAGEMQVAANGWPLYYFAEDQADGDVGGQGLNDMWWLLTPEGEPIRDDEMEDDEMEDDGPEEEENDGDV